MAKKEAQSEDGEKPEGEAAAAPPNKGFKRFLTKKMLMIAVPVLVLVLAGGGAGAYFFLFKKGGGAESAKSDMPLTPPKVAFSDMQDILVNIQSNDGTPAYLKLGLSLELEDEQ
jgi:flagellar FliL protein